MSSEIFGTDGIRALVGSEKMHPQFIMHLGWALGKSLRNHKKPEVLIGKDTRISGYMFESALESGLSAAGVSVKLLGPLPTPGIAYLTKTLQAQAGVVISASHNPFHDNGIKFFNENGHKLAAEEEKEIEYWMQQPMHLVDSADLGKVKRLIDASSRYIEFCKSTVSHQSLKKFHVVIDCANGAAYTVAPMILEELGARVTVIGTEPNGLNINNGIGSTHPEVLSQKVKEVNANLGIALDGDADRCILCDNNGKIIDGDEITYIIAKHRHIKGKLKGPVVGTLMTNLGIEQALNNLGIDLIRSNVGDKYVLADMLKHGSTVGGELSGHILCLDKTSTGDGMISSLQVIRAMIDLDQSLTKILSDVKKMPAILINVAISDAKSAMESKLLTDAITEAEEKLANRGRILLRASGTEPILRVMVEGSDKSEVQQIANNLADIVRQFS